MDGHRVSIGTYGTFKQDFVYRPTTGSIRGPDDRCGREISTAVLLLGSAMALVEMLPRLQGGDVFVKRALSATLSTSGITNSPRRAGRSAGAFEIETLFGNLATAKDYAAYRQNAANIDALVKAEPDSQFSATWIATLARAYELGLHKRNVTDWAGGWTAFLDETFDGRINGAAFAPTNLSFTLSEASRERTFGFFSGDGTYLGAMGDTIDTSSKDEITGTSGADTIEMNGTTLSGYRGPHDQWHHRDRRRL